MSEITNTQLLFLDNLIYLDLSKFIREVEEWKKERGY